VEPGPGIERLRHIDSVAEPRRIAKLRGSDEPLVEHTTIGLEGPAAMRSAPPVSRQSRRNGVCAEYRSAARSAVASDLQATASPLATQPLARKRGSNPAALFGFGLRAPRPFVKQEDKVAGGNVLPAAYGPQH
jgi:hypothetical protein